MIINPTHLQVLDFSLGVFRTDDMGDGDIDSRPDDWQERKFVVHSCEGDVVTDVLPWPDARWLANILNKYSDEIVDTGAVDSL